MKYVRVAVVPRVIGISSRFVGLGVEAVVDVGLGTLRVVVFVDFGVGRGGCLVFGRRVVFRALLMGPVDNVGDVLLQSISTGIAEVKGSKMFTK